MTKYEHLISCNESSQILIDALSVPVYERTAANWINLIKLTQYSLATTQPYGEKLMITRQFLIELTAALRLSMVLAETQQLPWFQKSWVSKLVAWPCERAQDLIALLDRTEAVLKETPGRYVRVRRERVLATLTGLSSIARIVHSLLPTQKNYPLYSLGGFLQSGAALGYYFDQGKPFNIPDMPALIRKVIGRGGAIEVRFTQDGRFSGSLDLDGAGHVRLDWVTFHFISATVEFEGEKWVPMQLNDSMAVTNRFSVLKYNPYVLSHAESELIRYLMATLYSDAQVLNYLNEYSLRYGRV